MCSLFKRLEKVCCVFAFAWELQIGKHCFLLLVLLTYPGKPDSSVLNLHIFFLFTYGFEALQVPRPGS